MNRLFIANISKQRSELFFRVPELRPLQRAVINPGSQIELAKSLKLTSAQQAAILDQIAAAGVIPTSELSRHKDGKLSLCWQFDYEIPIDKIKLGLERNDVEMLKISDEVRESFAANSVDRIARLNDKMKLSEFKIEMSSIEKTPFGVIESSPVRTLTASMGH